MHDSGLVDALVEAVKNEVGEKNLEKVKTVKVDVGALSKYSPDAIELHYKEFVEGTNLAKSVLEIRLVSAELKCQNCGLAIKSETKKLLCPSCGNFLEIVSGEEVILDSVKLS